MSKSQKVKRKTIPPAAARAGWRIPRLGAVALAAAVVVGGGFWWSQGRHADTQVTDTPVIGTNAASQAALTATPSLGFEKLKGKWQRPDGGYIIEIRSVGPSGKMDAAYFNPQPIHVAKAEASQDGGTVKGFIELRDVNYPGSTYTLVHDPATDQLKGIYYQAALQQQFEVSFEKLK